MKVSKENKLLPSTYHVNFENTERNIQYSIRVTTGFLQVSKILDNRCYVAVAQMKRAV